MPYQADGWQESDPSSYLCNPKLDAARGSDAEATVACRIIDPPPVWSSDPPVWSSVLDQTPHAGRIPWIESVCDLRPNTPTTPHSQRVDSHTFDGDPLDGDGRPAPSSEGFPGAIGNPSEAESGSLAGLAHDSRTMVAGIELYCDLLEAPGVLARPFRHYARDLRLLAGSGRRLLQRLASLGGTLQLAQLAIHRHSQYDGGPGAGSDLPASLDAAVASDDSVGFDASNASMPSRPFASGIALVNKRSESLPSPRQSCRPESMEADDLSSETSSQELLPTLARGVRGQAFDLSQPIRSLADELLANHRLIAALSGPAITVGLTIKGGHKPLPIAADELTRVLVNLAKNAAEAMPSGGHLQLDLEETPEALRLSITDTGTGIPESAVETIFSPGFTTRIGLSSPADGELSNIPAALAPDGSRSGLQSEPLSPHPQTVLPGINRALNANRVFHAEHRGLGLAIVRSIVTKAGGVIWAFNRPSDPLENSPAGAAFIVEFPVHLSHLPSRATRPSSNKKQDHLPGQEL